MKAKTGVKVNGLKPEILWAMGIVEDVYQEHGQELVITSCVDGKHSATSLHYIGHAFDARTKCFPEKKRTSTVNLVAALIRSKLTKEFDVVVEKTHIHIEFQPKYG